MSESQDLINERINFLIEKYEDGVRRRFAIKVGVSPGMISDLFSERKNKPGLDMVRKILKAYPQISTDWLVFGIGQMLKSGYADAEAKKDLPYMEPEEELAHSEEPESEYEPGESVEVGDWLVPTFTKKGHKLPAGLPGTDLVHQVARNTADIKELRKELDRLKGEQP